LILAEKSIERFVVFERLFCLQETIEQMWDEHDPSGEGVMDVKEMNM